MENFFNILKNMIIEIIEIIPILTLSNHPLGAKYLETYICQMDLFINIKLEIAIF